MPLKNSIVKELVEKYAKPPHRGDRSSVSMELTGIEPATSGVQNRRSPN
jgi:hypothetical protein